MKLKLKPETLRRLLIASALTAAVSAAVLAVCLGTQLRRARRLENSLEGVYAAACYELEDRLLQLELALTKLAVSGSKAGSTVLLADCSRLADKAQCTLSRLPVSHTVLADIHAFANRAGDYTHMLLDQTAEGTPLTARALQDAADMAAALEQLRARLGQLDAAALTQTALEPGGYYAAAPTAQDAHTAQLPTLIYDGPFSDRTANQKPLGLPEGWCDSAQAESAALAFLGEGAPDHLTRAADVEGSLPCYTFLLGEGAQQQTLQVSRAGARAVRLLGPAPQGEAVYSPEACLLRAEAWLAARHSGNFTLIGHTCDGPCYTFSFAPVEEGVVLYPDQVKVKLSAVTGEPCGYDAANYYTCHTARALPTPVLTPREAELACGSGLSVTRVRLALIPTDNRGEQLCYEITGTLGENTCYLYVNAVTGREEDILIALASDRGLLTL